MSPVRQFRRQLGIGLIEVLVGLVVLAFGLLAVSQLQSKLAGQSGESKARAEAVALAQQQIEAQRNYIGSVADSDADGDVDQDDFAAAFPADITSETVAGTHADFTREVTITNSGDTRLYSVNVSWQDRTDTQQYVVLKTELTWQPPRLAGDLGATPAAPLIKAPTGRASLGDGKVPAGTPTSANGDGTEQFDDGDDRKLVVGDDVVLTLHDACATDECVDFVKIKGRVYIDKASQNKVAAQVYVKASDAAYCHRYFLNDAGEPVTVSAGIPVPSTPNGNYEYYEYTCYIGGGWHGNIGILIDGGIKQSDKICIGDPHGAFNNLKPVIAARRVYRGMVYKLDNGAPVTDADGETIYYSAGIKDALELPVPGSGQPGHDFVVASMSAKDTDGSLCGTPTASGRPMTRTDSKLDEGLLGERFLGVPAGFVCLNDGWYDTGAYPEGEFGASTHCPYDPADPPSTRYTVSGSITVKAPASDANAAEVAKIAINTSDGVGNCQLQPFSYGAARYTASYSCDVYVWTTGWAGKLLIDEEPAPLPASISCDETFIEKTNVTSNSAGNDFNCSIN
jgi:Tfp pilus assembly protein PilV